MTDRYVACVDELDTAAICQKRPYTSPHHAKVAHRRASWRVRVYQCEDCGHRHVVNHEKKV